MIYLELFWAFFQIGLFSIGGGYAALPLIQNQVVDAHMWLTMEQFADVITIAEMTPGPIAINAATFVGIQTSGILGAIVSTLGCIVPSTTIVLILATLYFKYRNLRVIKTILSKLRVAVVAMIMSATLSIISMAIFKNVEGINYLSAFVFFLAFFAIRVSKLSPIKTIFFSGFIYTITSLLIQ